MGGTRAELFHRSPEKGGRQSASTRLARPIRPAADRLEFSPANRIGAARREHPPLSSIYSGSITVAFTLAESVKVVSVQLLSTRETIGAGVATK
jgi:hypothetical protein